MGLKFFIYICMTVFIPDKIRPIMGLKFFIYICMTVFIPDKIRPIMGLKYGKFKFEYLDVG